MADREKSRSFFDMQSPGADVLARCGLVLPCELAKSDPILPANELQSVNLVILDDNLERSIRLGPSDRFSLGFGNAGQV